MRIHVFVWPQDRIDHIDRHAVTPEEVEEACFAHALVQAKSEAKTRFTTFSDRPMPAGICSVWYSVSGWKGYPITAREMTDKEKRRYRQWKNR